MSGGTVLDQIEIELRGQDNQPLTVYVDVYNSSLSRKWLAALNQLLTNNYHLEKNYCFFGIVEHERNGQLILEQANRSIAAINAADLGYQINDYFSMDNCIADRDDALSARTGITLKRNLIHDRLNWLHRYFEDLQGTSGHMSPFFLRASAETRWHIRQLNLLCHEFESWALSFRMQLAAPEWQRPSQLMCWLQAPRFALDQEDYELFGVDTINRPLGGVFVGVNKAVGKHHWEVFCDEGRDVSELITTTLKSQTEAAGDFDIEWANNPGTFPWQQKKIAQFRDWLIHNGFDPNDKSLTIGHPQVAQVDLLRTFGSIQYQDIWTKLVQHLDVYSVKTSSSAAHYDYRWSDDDFMARQVAIINQGNS